MTPKEKAQEIFDSFFNFVKTYKQQKECALILVSELIKENVRYDYLPFENSRTEFYLQVQEEIQKL